MDLEECFILFITVCVIVVFTVLFCYPIAHSSGYEDGINETKYYYHKDIQECFIHVGEDEYRVSCNDPFPFDKAKIIGTNVEVIDYE